MITVINNRLGQLLLLALAFSFGSHVSAQTSPTKEVVRINVKGKWTNNAPKEKDGTGFFVSEGFVLTAAHVVGPKMDPTDGDVEWAEPPMLTITYVGDDNNHNDIIGENCSILYIDEQVDLALIGTTPITGRSGIPLRNLRNFDTGQEIEVVAFGKGRAEPTIVSGGSIDTPFNFNRSHRGNIDINVSGLLESDSGSPVLVNGEVIGIFLQGQRVARIGDVAAPISFAAPLLAMAGIDYPQPTVKDIILTSTEENTLTQVTQLLTELKQEIVAFRYEVRTGNLVVTYQKRLKSGWDPSTVRLHVKPIFRNQTLRGFETSFTPVASKTKSGGGIVIDFSDQVQNYLNRYNETASARDLDQYDIEDLQMVRILPTPVWDSSANVSGDEEDVPYSN